MKTIAIYHLKGGVGKTATAVNLAYLSAAQGYKTLLWDLDAQNASRFYYGIHANQKNTTRKILAGEISLASAIQPTQFPLLDVVPADLSARLADISLNEAKHRKKQLLHIINSIYNQYDIIMLDCPPGISLLHDNIFAAAHFLIMPTIPTTLSVGCLETVIAYFEKQEWDVSKIKCFFNLVDHRKKLHHDILQQLYTKTYFLKNYIPNLSEIEKMGINQLPLPVYAPKSFGTQCYTAIWENMLEFLTD